MAMHMLVLAVARPAGLVEQPMHNALLHPEKCYDYKRLGFQYFFVYTIKRKGKSLTRGTNGLPLFMPLFYLTLHVIVKSSGDMH